VCVCVCEKEGTALFMESGRWK